MPVTLDVEVERLKRNNSGSFAHFDLEGFIPLCPLIMKVLPKTGDDSRAIIDYEARQSVEEMKKKDSELPSRVFYDVGIVNIAKMGDEETAGTMCVGYQFYGRR